MLDIESITNTIINDDCMNILKQLPDNELDKLKEELKNAILGE